MRNRTQATARRLSHFLTPLPTPHTLAHSHPAPRCRTSLVAASADVAWLSSCSPGSTNVHNAQYPPSRPLLSSNLPQHTHHNVRSYKRVYEVRI